MSETPLLIATRSVGKLRELIPLLAPLRRSILTLDQANVTPSSAEDDVESFETFEDNAAAKARYFHALTGLDTIADDSGLEVLTLGGAPGVRSKRWSGAVAADDSELEALNRLKLLRELQGASDRRAKFVCAAAYEGIDSTFVVRGETSGSVLQVERGRGGFGYDSLFLSDELKRTLAECDPEEKEAVSHRGRAFRQVVERLTARA